MLTFPHSHLIETCTEVIQHKPEAPLEQFSLIKVHYQGKKPPRQHNISIINTSAMVLSGIIVILIFILHSTAKLHCEEKKS